MTTALSDAPRVIPRIAPYHSGPYRLGAILQDPGTIHGSGCNAQKTGEIGVLNGDPTANLCRQALEANGIPLSAYLPMNAIPWYDAPASRPARLLKQGAAHNRRLILEAGVDLVLLLGRQAWTSARYLDLPDRIEIRRLPHPGRLGLVNYRENGTILGASEARKRLIAGFALR
ncbi:hypothetical protein [Rhodovulum kholense]|uniref:Uracil DNA glycosylase superfamily protein n=1 Tax=Rhodovulum kholense TaxID=453584 RepID=A0A8E3AP57_9RHOB|nr:hypothetical protein [Rhodovulum kholense]PTW44283.1 hypothetical protein C8N38_11717 [Rhodovulum kholense]